MTGGGYRFFASANFGELVLGCIEAKFCKELLKTSWKALAEIYTMHSFAPLWNRIPKNEENQGGKDPGPIPGKQARPWGSS